MEKHPAHLKIEADEKIVANTIFKFLPEEEENLEYFYQ